jgi:hypothetical protein
MGPDVARNQERYAGEGRQQCIYVFRVIRTLGVGIEMGCVSCEVRTEFLYLPSGLAQAATP